MRDTAIWSVPKRLGFLVLAIFLVLNAAPLLIAYVPFVGPAVLGPYMALWNVVVVWLGEHVLGLPEPITILPNGSGDTTWNYVQLFGMVMLSLIVGGAWALVDRRRAHYAFLHHWLLVIVRHALSVTMVMYGLAKVFPLQFQFPSLTVLTQTYGESSPMGLAWNFMGYSAAYNVFTGSAEILGGLLLLWRRTTTLGAFVAIGLMSHIVALNFCYDIPVKLFSSTLLLMAVYLFADDARRFVDALVLGRATPALELRPHFVGKGPRRVRAALKALFAVQLGVMTLALWTISRDYGPGAPKPALYGLYEVETFTLAGEVRPPLTTDEQRWRHFIVEAYGYAVVRTMDSKREFFGVDTDLDRKTIVLWQGRGNERVRHEFTYERPTAELLILRGSLGCDPVEITLRKRDPGDFLLVRRGFHWVNEYPFNR